MDPAVDDIVGLTRAFLAGQVGAPDFDRDYRDRFSRMPILDETTFETLQDLAFACADYVEDPALRDEPGDLDESALAEAARAALTRLGLS